MRLGPDSLKPQVGALEDDTSFEKQSIAEFIFLDDTDPKTLKQLCAKKVIVGSSPFDQQGTHWRRGQRLPSLKIARVVH
jgi:hypothetical protein